MKTCIFSFIRASIFLSAIFLMACATPGEKGRNAGPEIESAPEVSEGAISCEEITSHSTNSSGIEAMPFMRISFFDPGNSAGHEMVIGNKSGQVYLYKNSGHPGRDPWKRVPGYFGDVRAGAFSSPVLADLDGDGKAELIVGTGGFSSGSGKILFFRNDATEDEPSWRKTDDPVLSVGNDAAVTVADYDFDGKPDIIATNSEGKIFFFKNVSAGGRLRFERDPSPPVRMNFGMYAVPAAKKSGDSVVLVVGNSMGKIYMFDIRKTGSGLRAQQRNPGIRTKTFASPAFADLFEKGRSDLVIADGDGIITYYENRNGNFSVFNKIETVFSRRISAGPVCAPTVTCLGEKTYLVVGNMDGSLRVFEHNPPDRGLQWTENREYLGGVKVPGFSRGYLIRWKGRELLVTGQGNGRIRAFLNTGGGRPSWKEDHDFFRGVYVKEHSTPVIYGPDSNGRWLLISGAADGRIYAYSAADTGQGRPVWKKIGGVFDNIKVNGFSSPSVVTDQNAVYLFVGRLDGRIRVFRADTGGQVNYASLRFHDLGFLSDIRMNEHSSPFVQLNNGIFDVIAGDYSGNLRQFLCKKNGI